MGHAVALEEVKYTGDKNKDRKAIMLVASEFASEMVDRGENPSGSYHGNMLIRNRVIGNREEAEEYLENKMGWYNDEAILFEKPILKKKTKRQIELEERKISILRQICELKVYDRKSNSITCPHCKKRVDLSSKKSVIKHRVLNIEEELTKEANNDGNLCPHCHKDLRSASTIAKEKTLRSKLEKTQKAIDELEKKRIKGTELKYLVKVEVHC